jgi:hypothetical protein
MSSVLDIGELNMNANSKRYKKEFSIAMLGYAILLPVSIHLLKGDSHSPLRFLWAILPALPAPFAVWAVVRFYRGLDELNRRIHLEGLSYSFPATLLIIFAYSFLQNAGLPPVDLIYVATMMIALWGLGLGIASRRYR